MAIVSEEGARRNAVSAAVVACPGLETAAAALAVELGLPLLTDPAGCSHWLRLTPERLELWEQGTDTSGPLWVEFTKGPLAHRRRFGGGRHQPLARAVGLKHGLSPTVVDATAGLGRDAFLLACLNCKVHLVERSPLIAALLRDGLHRAAQDPAIGSLVNERLRLTVEDGQVYLQQLPVAHWPEVVYLDPMYPHRQKSALVKKDMRILRRLVGADADAAGLLAIARTRARRRVVVKRPRLAPVLEGPPPTFQISAPNTRFDIYLSSHSQPLLSEIEST